MAYENILPDLARVMQGARPKAANSNWQMYPAANSQPNYGLSSLPSTMQDFGQMPSAQSTFNTGVVGDQFNIPAGPTYASVSGGQQFDPMAQYQQPPVNVPPINNPMVGIPNTSQFQNNVFDPNASVDTTFMDNLVGTNVSGGAPVTDLNGIDNLGNVVIPDGANSVANNGYGDSFSLFGGVNDQGNKTVGAAPLALDMGAKLFGAWMNYRGIQEAEKMGKYTRKATTKQINDMATLQNSRTESEIRNSGMSQADQNRARDTTKLDKFGG